MEFIQLPSFIQSTDGACDRFSRNVQIVRAEIVDTISLLPELVAHADILGTVRTIALNTIWCVAFAVAFAFYSGQAAGQAWYRWQNRAAIVAEICRTPDDVLDELLPFLEYKWLQLEGCHADRFRSPLLSSTVKIGS